MDTADPVLAQLKKLREARGLGADRLAGSPAVLAALATSDASEAYGALCLLLGNMGDGERVRALKVDFGLDLKELLQRPPTSREQDWLGDRRAGYATIVGRDVKTLSRWSDRALSELRSQLLTDTFDGQLIVSAGVQNRRVTGVEVMRFDKDDTNLSNGRNTGYTNPEPDTSLPLVLFGFPRHWQPNNIRFIIAFLHEDYPRHVWALVADGVLDVGFGHERTELEIVDGMARCRIEEPRWDQLYGVWWEW